MSDVSERRQVSCALPFPGSYSSNVQIRQEGAPAAPVESASSLAGDCSSTVAVPMSLHPGHMSCAFPDYQRPVHRTVTFRDWYVSNYCNDAHVSTIARVQAAGSPSPLAPSRLTAALTLYFRAWSLTGEAEFYTLFIPLAFWLGMPTAGLSVSIMMAASQWITGTLKDTFACPRPPCPPLELRGSKQTHLTEYGFPSTHSSHGVVFAFWIYSVVRIAFADYSGWWALFCVFFAVNVAASRVFLGMHWPADLIGGLSIAVAIITFYTAFLSSLIDYAVYHVAHPGAAHFLVLILAFHALVTAHAAPPQACPCYIDSVRFAGGASGALGGIWLLRLTIGSPSIRPDPLRTGDWSSTFAYASLKGYAVSFVALVIAKELSSILSGIMLRWLFIFLSGAMRQRLPWVLHRPYSMLCFAAKVVFNQPRIRPACTAAEAQVVASPVALGYFSSVKRMMEYDEKRNLEKERRRVKVSPTSTRLLHHLLGRSSGKSTPPHSHIAPQGSNLTQRVSPPVGTRSRDVEPPAGAFCTPFGTDRPHDTTTSGSTYTNRNCSHSPISDGLPHEAAENGVALSTDDGVVTVANEIGTDDGARGAYVAGRSSAVLPKYFSVYENCEQPNQQWTLVTHTHWWLWDVHKRSVSYIVVGLMATFSGPLIQRYLFNVGVTT